MAVIKQACPKCGQRVSGDESFYGTSVDCPICSAKIFFPDPDAKSGSPGPNAPSSERGGKAPGSDQPASGSDKRRSGEDDIRRESSGKSPVQSRNDDNPTAPVKPPASPRPGGQAEHQYAYEEPPSATLSIISMVLGILNAVTFCIPSLLLAPAAIICGHIALVKGKFSPIQPAPGRSMAITGLILGYLGMAVLLVVLALTVTGVFNFFEWFGNQLEPDESA